MPMSLDEREKWGALTERVKVLERSIEKLEAQAHEEKRRAFTWRITWIQLVVGGLLAIATTVGGGVLVAVITARWID